LVDSGNFSSSTASITFKEDDDSEPETAYFGSWHTHNPSEHLVDGKHLQGEMHFVHYTADGTPRSVIAHRIEPSDDVKDSFFSQLPELFTTEQKSMDQDINLDLSSVSEIAGLWTYQGSLTTPPCSQGIRWFVVEEPLKVSNKDLQRWLRASKYSARPEQFLWEQHLNE
jgi:carbonic anhydrase